MSFNPKLLSPVQSATVNPCVEFRNGQFLFRMMNQEGGLTERFISHASVLEAFSGIPLDSGWLRPEVVRWGDGQKGEWAVVFIPPGVHELEITREALAAPTDDRGPQTAECALCVTGFPVNEAGEHYGTQALGMIPNRRCELLPAVAGQPSPVVHDIDRIKTPLPGLVFFGLGTRYFIWAVKTPQVDPYHEVYRCPLPNVEANGLICFGNLKPPRATARTIFDAFELFIKSTFNNHRCEGKSKTHRDDVRLVLRSLGEKGNGEGVNNETSPLPIPPYPVDDLMRQVDHTGVTLDKAIREYFEAGEMPE